MDFGIDRIIEMFEARFGRWAGTSLLLIVALGAISLSLHAFFLYVVIPVTDFWRKAASEWHWSLDFLLSKQFWNAVATLLAGGAMGLLAALIFVILVTAIFARISIKGKRLITDMESISDEVHVGLTEYRAAIAEAKAMNLDTAKIEGRIGEKLAAKAALPAPQSPQDTGEGKQQ